jgi:hypothetical protein
MSGSASCRENHVALQPEASISVRKVPKCGDSVPHMNLLHMQLGAGIKRRLEEIDAEVQLLHAEGYGVDADRLLDERIDLAQAREDLKRKVLS